MTLSKSLLFASQPETITFGKTGGIDEGDHVVFLPAGDATCFGAMQKLGSQGGKVNPELPRNLQLVTDCTDGPGTWVRTLT